MTEKITKIVIIVAVVGIITYDIVMATNKTSGDTVSEVIWQTIKGNPWIPFLVGFVCGHLFWNS